MHGNKVAITGVGETAFQRKSETPLMRMIAEACLAAIADAGLKPGDIDGIVGNRMVAGADDIGHAVGLPARKFGAVTDTAGGTATSGQALILAQLAIEAGLATHVLVPYGIQSSKPGGVYGIHAKEPQKAALEMPVGFFGQPTYFAAMANRYAHDNGLSEEELASVSMTYRAWAVLNPGAQKRDPMGLDEYRQSPMISTPLRAADCCLTTDGAGAYIVSAVERARDMPHPLVQVSGVALATSPYPLGVLFTQTPCLYDFPAGSGEAAFAMAGLSPKDIDVAQIYDGFSISALVQTEMLGLCGRGEGGRFYASGAARPGGAKPVNTCGGHMSGGYVPGMNLLIEGVRQLRGGLGERQVPDAKVCAVTGLGGNSHSTTLLTRG